MLEYVIAGVGGLEVGLGWGLGGGLGAWGNTCRRIEKSVE